MVLRRIVCICCSKVLLRAILHKLANVRVVLRITQNSYPADGNRGDTEVNDFWHCTPVPRFFENAFKCYEYGTC